MDLILIRSQFLESGIFGELKDSLGRHIAFTLEHAYPMGSNFVPKIPPGVHTCVKGSHRLLGMNHDFVTFEIQVRGHSNILFHPGNYNQDSSGCVLLGESIHNNSMITNSKVTFEKVIALQDKCDQFQLTVLNPF